MKAVLAAGALDDAPNLSAWLHHAAPAASRLKQETAPPSGLASHDRLSQLNVLTQLDHLLTYPIVRAAVEGGALRLSGWWFDIATGDMFTHRPGTGSFEVIDRRLAERLIAGE